MIDWHCHLLPAIDDGPASLTEAVELSMALHGAGFHSVHCTPHYIRGFHDADNGQVLDAIGQMQDQLVQRGIPLRLLQGREYYLDEFFPEVIADPLTLGDSRLLLVEIPPHANADFVRASLSQAVSAGLIPLIAHPERCRLLDPPEVRETLTSGFLGFFRRPLPAERQPSTVGGRPTLLEYLRDIGCAFQGNLGSFVGLYGEGVRKVAMMHLASGLYSHFGSDAHSPHGLGRWLGKGLSAVTPDSGTMR
jgi:protein-tyrosine phosphatase